MPTIVLAHEDPSLTQVEEEILKSIDAHVIHRRNLDALTRDGLGAQVAALMVGTERVTAQHFAQLPRLRIVSRVGTGLDAIDLVAASQYGVWVTNVPDFSVEEVSTHALSLLLAHARGLPKLFEQARRSVWDAVSIRPIERLQDQTVGVVGFGRIGQAFARKARGLGVQLIAYDVYMDDQTIEAAGARPVTWETLLRTSDYISLHAPLNAETHHLVNASAFALMKPNAFLINTARGGLVDADALLAAVRAGRMAGAAMDVFETEPLPADHPLFQQEQILITPHVAWYSEASMRDVKVRATEEVVRVLRGELPRCPANQINPNMRPNLEDKI